jgi:hypothetical protein
MYGAGVQQSGVCTLQKCAQQQHSQLKATLQRSYSTTAYSYSNAAAAAEAHLSVQVEEEVAPIDEVQHQVQLGRSLEAGRSKKGVRRGREQQQQQRQQQQAWSGVRCKWGLHSGTRYSLLAAWKLGTGHHLSHMGLTAGAHHLLQQADSSRCQTPATRKTSLLHKVRRPYCQYHVGQGITRPIVAWCGL